MHERLKFVVERAGLVWPEVATADELAELAVDVFLRPPPSSRMTPREAGYMETARRGMLTTRAGALAAWTWGSGTAPVVGLVHGWAGRGSQLGAFAAPLVTAGFQVVAFDGPAHGESPGVEASVPRLAECIVEIAVQRGGVHALIGHSIGAASAAMATMIGLTTKGLVMIAPPLSHRRRMERVAAGLELTPEVRTLFYGAAERRVGWKDEDVDMRVVARRAPCPALVFHDPQDDYTEFSGSEEFVAQWSGARLVPCPGRGHLRILTTTEVVAETVRFVAAL